MARSALPAGCQRSADVDIAVGWPVRLPGRGKGGRGHHARQTRVKLRVRQGLCRARADGIRFTTLPRHSDQVHRIRA